jgi:flagellar motor switch protein FliN/FliY
MRTYFDSWVEVAAALFSQALAGEPELAESLPKPLGATSFGFSAILAGDLAGHFSIILDGSILEAPLLGEGVDQKGAWNELLRETVDAAAGDMLARTGKKCKVTSFEPIAAAARVSQCFQLHSGDRAWTILVDDAVKLSEAPAPAPKAPESKAPERSAAVPAAAAAAAATASAPAVLSSGLELLLDVELQTSLRFGSREMPLGEILDLGPGDVVELDRHVADPVDLIVGDKIVARGEVVLVNGNFGLRVTEVAIPRKRLESIRCLF